MANKDVPTTPVQDANVIDLRTASVTRIDADLLTPGLQDSTTQQYSKALRLLHTPDGYSVGLKMMLSDSPKERHTEPKFDRDSIGIINDIIRPIPMSAEYYAKVKREALPDSQLLPAANKVSDEHRARQVAVIGHMAGELKTLAA